METGLFFHLTKTITLLRRVSMRLLLSGGSDAAESEKIDKFFASQIKAEQVVLYVPIAAYEPGQYLERYKRIKSRFQKFGITNIEMCTVLNTVRADSRYSAIYIDGGNTFKLLKEVRESGFDTQIFSFLNEGGIIYGLSAGSIIFGRNIIGTTYETENCVGLEDSRGLNLAKGFDVCCHYRNDADYKRNRIIKFSAESKGTIALSDGCAAFIEDEKITFIGDGAILFTP
jgi:Peptidase E